jgi:hypothetical protein
LGPPRSAINEKEGKTRTQKKEKEGKQAQHEIKKKTGLENTSKSIGLQG